MPLMGCALPLSSVDSLASIVCLDLHFVAGILNLTVCKGEGVAMDKQCGSPMDYMRTQTMSAP